MTPCRDVGALCAADPTFAFDLTESETNAVRGALHLLVIAIIPVKR